MGSQTIQPPCFRGECESEAAKQPALRSFCADVQHQLVGAGGAALLEQTLGCAVKALNRSLEQAHGASMHPEMVALREKLGITITTASVEGEF